MFWPGLWLPLEPGIKDARIFTFGYNADWRSPAKSIANITDFAKELLFELTFGRDDAGEDLDIGAKPIIFVVHSMGGLVVKKAYLLGLHDANYQPVVEATSAIIFLSTPHRGTNLAKTLNKVLAASLQSPKVFISDLSKNSPAIEELNEQFRHVAPRLSIWSFYETVATSIGPGKTMVLEKDTSVLGYPGEVSRPLQADHHDVCKFSGPTDPNYIAVRNAIKSLMTRLGEPKPKQNPSIKPKELEEPRAPPKMAEIAEAIPNLLLEPPKKPDDESLDSLDLFRDCPIMETDYDALRRCLVPGTCEWFLEDDKFISWMASPSLEPAILWYTAPPANGKSVLSTFIIHHLRSKGVSCQFFLFKYSDNAKRTVANCVKSLALQLSRSQPEFRSLLAASSREALGLDSSDLSDPFLIWKNVMEGLLLPLKLSVPIYWVIDALDECDSPKTFLECLKSFANKLPVRVLVLSRATDSISIGFNRLSRSISISRIEKSSTGHNHRDIELLAQTELEHVRGSNQFRDQLLRDIMKRSEGNFLWVNMVIEEIMGCHTEESIREVLERTPSDMTRMFQHMESNMLKSIRQSDKPLIRSLLEWSTCAQRPLSIKELSQALQPEFSGFLDLKRTVQETCGQFVQVDDYDKVALLHHTTREYFTQTTDSEFHVDLGPTHEKLLIKSLKVFADQNLRWRLLQHQHELHSSEPFVFYSAVSWPFHLAQSGACSPDCLSVLMEVFRGPGVLAWVHTLALLRRLEVLFEASTVLTMFINAMRRIGGSENSTSLDQPGLDTLREWAGDLVRLVGRFASHIVANPAVLYYVIPAICPPRSIMQKQFHRMANIKLTGVADTNWDDNLCRLILPSSGRAWEMKCVSKYLAILSSDGSVYVWDASTFSEVSVINHGEPIVTFNLSGNGGKLCTYGLGSTKIWSTQSGELLSSTSNFEEVQARTVVFIDNDRKLLMGGDDNVIRHMSCDKAQTGWQVLHRDLLREKTHISGAILNSPAHIAFNGDRTQVGVSYRGAPLSVWGLRDGKCINRCRRADMPVNQHQPSSNWFAVDRFTWNPVTGHIIGIYRALSIFKWHPITDENVEARCVADEIAASPNGKLFATSNPGGSIRVWDFARFVPIYQLSAEEDLVTELAFSADSRRFHDIRGGTINTWEPNGLARFLETDGISTDQGDENQNPRVMQKFEKESKGEFGAVTTFSLALDGRSYAVGYEDGTVELFQKGRTDGQKLTQFFNCMCVVRIRWSADARIIAVGDLAGEIKVLRISTDMEEAASPAVSLPAPNYDSNTYPIREMILSPDGRHILIATEESFFVCSTSDGELAAQTHAPADADGKWLCHPTQPDIALLCGALGVKAYRWDTLELVWSMAFSKAAAADIPGPEIHPDPTPRSLTIDTKTKQTVKRALITQDSCHVLVYTSKTTYLHGFSNALHIVPIAALPGGDGTGEEEEEEEKQHSSADSVSAPAEVVANLLMPLGILPGRRFVFIDRDLWLCSYPLGQKKKGGFHSATGALYNRFYFIPRNWVAKQSLEECVLARDGTLFWPKGDGVVRIECSLDETRHYSVF